MFLTTCIKTTSQTLKTLLMKTSNFICAPTCLLCGLGAKRSLCQACIEDLPILPHHCYQCAKFLPFSTSIRCGDCLSAAPPFVRTHALFKYEFPISNLILNLKFGRQLTVSKILGELFCEKISVWYEHKSLPDMVIPIPLHRLRLQERGFNQAIELIKPTIKTFKLPFDRLSLVRDKNTQAQSGLNAKQRKQNVAGAFKSYKTFEAKTIALFDDVITTGQTIRACSQVLLKHGAAEIHVWCIARRG